MTLPLSGTLKLSDIRTELSATGQITLASPNTRSLASIASGEISISDLYGKTYTPPVGINWTLRSVPSPLDAVNGGSGTVCGNSSGFIFVCYDSSPAGNHALYSADGVTWTNITSTITAALGAVKNSITSIAVDGLFILGTDGSSIYSTDGITWQALTSLRTVFNTNISLLRITHTGSQFIAVGESARCGTSPDGITWTQRTGLNTAVGAISINDVCWTGSNFVAVGNGDKCATSPDGITWTNNSSFTTLVGSANHVKTVCSNGSIVVATTSSGPARCVISTDHGITWSAISSGITQNFIRCLYVNSTFVGVTATKYLYTSPDGLTWTEQTQHRTLMAADTTYECDIAYSTSHNLLVAFAYSASKVRCLTSP